MRVCQHCDEIIEAHEIIEQANWHRECLLRCVTGSAAHIRRQRDGLPCNWLCHEYEYTISKRQAAIEAFEAFNERDGLSH
jgi:hypothetical protein